ncbi:MAG: ClpP family protease [Planctomycetota bacterium]
MIRDFEQGPFWLRKPLDPMIEEDDPDDPEEPDKEDEGKGGAGDDQLLKLMLKTRTILVSSPVSDKLYQKVVQQLTLLEAQDANAPIHVYVNSPGGSADSGFAIYDAMRFVTCPIVTICNGICASAAVIIFLGGDKDKRVSLPNSRFLLHQPSTAGQGTASDLSITAREIIKIREKYNGIVAEATGKSIDKVTKDSDRDFWLSATEAVEYGLASKVITEKKELPR